MKKLHVLLIEDDPMVCEVNRQFIERVEGFSVIATAKNGRMGLELIETHKPDLIFMDMFMPEKNGLETLLNIRAKALPLDVIVVTADNSHETIQQTLRLGVADYIMKPFTFERIEKALLRYQKTNQLLNETLAFSQESLDSILYGDEQVQQPLHDVLQASTDELPKGFNKATLNKVLHFLQQTNEGASADEVATNIGVARVTARRYLDFMEKQQLIKVEIQYGSVGRPINQYFILH